jgi:rod shape-determining protein MreD
MFRWVKLFLYLVLVIILQVCILPAYLEDPFKPNFMIILVSYLALREEISFFGALLSYLLGLLQGTFSGVHFGLAGISMLLIYMLLKKVADQLYTDSDHLMVVVVFIATLIDALTSMVFILLFSTSTGIYNSFLTNMVPQAVVNALVASLLFGFSSIGSRRERL